MFNSLKNQAIQFIEPYKNQNPATYAAAEQAVGTILIADGFFGLPHPMGGKQRPGIFGTIGGMVIGIILMLVSTLFGNVFGINRMTATTPARVVSVTVNTATSPHNGTTCSLVANYNINGTDYTQAESGSSSDGCGLVQGQTITINYDPASPGSWFYGVTTVKWFDRIFFWVGVLVLVSSIISFFIRLFSIIFGWKLLRDGRKNASSLPGGTNLSTIIGEIKQNFVSNVFGFPATPRAPSSPSDSSQS